MKRALSLALAVLLVSAAHPTSAQDWPQWRGPNRDARAVGFKAPESWPKELKEEWRVTVGDGVATPSLVGERLYVFSRQGGNEVVRCLTAATGEEVWQDKYTTEGATGGASGFSGPRSSPAVSDGKVVTLGVRGVVSCYDASSGDLLWRKDEYRNLQPTFFTSSSPIIVDGLCIVQQGGRGRGAMIAYDLASGEEKWKAAGDGAAYGSPVVITLGDAKAVIAPTESNLLAVDPTDGQVLWQVRYSQGRYNAATPMVDGQTLIYAGPNRGTTAETLQLEGKKIVAKERWKNADNSLQFNTPVLRDGHLYGLSNLGSLFCVNAETGETVWTSSLEASAGPAREGQRPPAAAQPGERGQPGGRAQPGGRRPGGFGGGRDRSAEYGSVVDAGSVLMALTPAGSLIVFEPSEKEFKKLASYQVASGNTYAYPVPSGNGIYIKDRDTVALWKIE
jgi:outer membrane protein assembly factor BamB